MSARLILTCGVLALAGCGDDGGAGGSPDGGFSGAGGAGGTGGAHASSDGTFTAVIDGMPWHASPTTVRSRPDEDIPGGYELQGTGGVGVPAQLRLALYYIDSPGTYAFGVAGSVVGASASYSRGTSSWQTPSSGDAGTLTITAITAERIAGTFTFELSPVPGTQATGTVSVTEGEFDLALDGEATEIGAGVGRSVSAELDGARFNAATVVVTPAPNGITFNALNDAYNIGFVLSEVDGEGTYELAFEPPLRTVVAIDGNAGDQEEHCCWGASPEDSGSVTFTTFTADRLAGTFELMLAPQSDSPAEQALVLTSGVFDIGRQDP